MREALSYSPGICWVATIILASHLAWITILFVFSEILLLQKEAMKVLKFRKKLNQSPWGEGGKLDNTEWFRKEYWLKRWGPHSVIFDNRLDHASSRKKISIFFFFFLSPVSSALVPCFIHSTVNWKRYYLHRPPCGGSILAVLHSFSECCVLEQKLEHFSYKGPDGKYLEP